MQEPRKILQQLGLSESEVEVYLAMLQGLISAREIIKMTRQKRPTVYYALSCLEKRGLISKTGKEGARRFALEPLERLQTIAEGKTKEDIQASLPPRPKKQLNKITQMPSRKKYPTK